MEGHCHRRELLRERSTLFVLCRPSHKLVVILVITVSALQECVALQNSTFDRFLNCEINYFKQSYTSVDCSIAVLTSKTRLVAMTFALCTTHYSTCPGRCCTLLHTARSFTVLLPCVRPAQEGTKGPCIWVLRRLKDCVGTLFRAAIQGILCWCRMGCLRHQTRTRANFAIRVNVRITVKFTIFIFTLPDVVDTKA